MQELIDELDLSKIVEKHNFFMVKYIIEQCLQKEKEQIKMAFIDGVWDSFKKIDSEEYYNQTYNQDRELPKDVKDWLNNL